MALTPFDMEGVNRDLLAAGNPAKPDMQSILRRNARDLVLGNAILVSSVDAKELEFGVHMAYSDADGERTGISSFETFDDLMNGDDSPFKDCEIDHIWDENGILKMRGHHHDGSVEVEIRQLTDQGCEALESYEQAWAGEPFDAAGRHYDGGKESVDRFWNDLKTDRGLSVEPRYVELAFGCPPIEWDIDARVRDFAERMGDEYTSLYEQDTTSIKGGDFERFGAFADNHLDFIRALTKARGMDPISSDREIGAFLNTFDKLAAMPEPTPAKQEKDELSAGACDPADPLNLEQSSSYGMTR